MSQDHCQKSVESTTEVCNESKPEAYAGYAGNGRRRGKERVYGCDRYKVMRRKSGVSKVPPKFRPIVAEPMIGKMIDLTLRRWHPIHGVHNAGRQALLLALSHITKVVDLTRDRGVACRPRSRLGGLTADKWLGSPGPVLHHAASYAASIEKPVAAFCLAFMDGCSRRFLG